MVLGGEVVPSIVQVSTGEVAGTLIETCKDSRYFEPVTTDPHGIECTV